MKNKKIINLVIIILVLSNLIMVFRIYKIEENKKFLIRETISNIYNQTGYIKSDF